MTTKRRIYVLSLAVLCFISFFASLILWLCSQDKLNELMETDPSAVVSAGTAPFLFTVVIYLLINAVSFGYITAWKVIPCCDYSKSELLLLSTIAFVVIICNFVMLNVSWECAFIALAVLLYEISTWLKYIYDTHKAKFKCDNE